MVKGQLIQYIQNLVLSAYTDTYKIYRLDFIVPNFMESVKLLK